MTRAAAYVFAAEAARDLDHILSESGRRFGSGQRARYAALIASAIARIADAPTRLGSRDEGAIEVGLRSYPVRLAARRRRAAVHVIFYKRVDGSVLIVRILHDAMDPAAHLSPTNDH